MLYCCRNGINIRKGTDIVKKRSNGWKAAFIILAVIVVLLIVFFIWVFSDDDDYYDDYYDEYYDDYEYQEQYGHGSNGSGGSSGAVSTVDNTSEHNKPDENEIVRDKLVALKGNGEDTVTVLVYMNGSDLETEDGEATDDLSEMVAAGSSDKVNVLVETLGTKKWNSKYGISSKTAQRYSVNGKGLKLVQDKVGNVNCGDASGLTDFIKWGVKNYPADRYILMFWDHGGGPVYGFGYDDKTGSEDTLTVAEMQKALHNAGTVFDFIGMDCCIMSGIEVCCALYDYCDYMILSEDFESGSGWFYTGWLKALYENTSISTPDLGKIIVDDMVSVNSKQGEDAILSVIDESYMKLLYSSWVDFAYANESTLLNTNYSRRKSRKNGYRISPVLENKNYFSPLDTESSKTRFGDYDEEDVEMSEYFITDLMAVADNIKSSESAALEASLNRSLVYMSACGDSSNLTGFSVTLPYGDAEFYDELREVFLDCGFDSDYVEWLSAFADSKQSTSYYNYDRWDSLWGGWDDYEDDYDWDDWDDWDYWDDWDEEDDWGWGWSGHGRY